MVSTMSQRPVGVLLPTTPGTAVHPMVLTAARLRGTGLPVVGCVAAAAQWTDAFAVDADPPPRGAPV